VSGNAQLLAMHRQAVSALNRGDFRQLVATCKGILSADRGFADAWFLLSVAAEAGRDLKRARALAAEALKLAPDNPEYLAQQAKYCALLNQTEEARDTARAAIQAGPERALTFDTLGVVFTRLGEHEQALSMLRRAIALEPENAQFHFNLASAEQFLGHAQAARDHYQQAISLRPGFARAYWALSELEKNSGGEARLEQLESLLSKRECPEEDKLYLGHALAREYEHREDYAAAFAALEQGKAARRAKLGYRIDDDAQLFDAMQRVFSAPDTAPRAREHQPEPLFIVGMPRSGTTLVERVLSSHPQVGSLGELQDFARAVKRVSGDSGPAALSTAVIGAAANADPEAIGEDYLEATRARLDASQSSLTYVIDKMPLNFLYVGFILRALPSARIVIVRRHPLDTVLSNYRQLFAVNFSYYNYHYDLLDTARYYLLFDRLMSHWTDLYGERLHILQYEALVAQPEASVEGLLDYLELPWSDACLAFHEQGGAVTTASTMQVREPLYQRAVGRWRHYEQQLEPVQRLFDAEGVSWS
jgi:Tfp pilus assembly protein PilF